MNHIERTIEDLESQIQQKRGELERLQNAVNSLCQIINVPPKYQISSQDLESQSLTLKGDEYFRKPTATVITCILQDRKTKNMGPATLDEIHQKMLEGGYVFDVKEPKIAVGTALGKNPKFTKIGENKWGLTEWYPKGKEIKDSQKNGNDNEKEIDSSDNGNETSEK
ncbi:MAG TPA: hypothetical protein PKB02_00245 [Anaerohalosphaeraceae bacterium]|nr:hypothetical protein [Anaerohalosphaeraceae bacterium]